MPLSTIWCNVQFGTWHFKWRLCFPDERDLGCVEMEGVLYYKPYLTAWINNPLFLCWAGAHPPLVLSFNNHAGFLSPLRCTVSYTEITNLGSTARVRAQCSIILPGALAWLRFLQFGLNIQYMSSPISWVPFSKSLPVPLLIFWFAYLTLQSPGPLTDQKVFSKTETCGVKGCV